MDDNNIGGADSGTSQAGSEGAADTKAKGSQNSGGNPPASDALDFSDIDNNDDLFAHQKEALKKERTEKAKAAKSKPAPKVEEEEEEVLDEESEEDNSGDEEEESEEEDTEDTEEEETDEESKKEAPKGNEKHRVKVNGKEYEVTTEQLKKSFQLEEAARTKINEATQAIQQKDAIVNLLQHGEEGLMYLLEQIHGPAKAREIIENAVYSKLKIEKMSPEARRAYEAEQELERYRAMEQQQKQEQAQRQNEQAKNQYKETYQKVFNDVMVKGSLPKTAFVQQQVLQAMNVLVSKGYDVTAESVIPFVKKQIQAHQKEMFELDPEQYVKTFGADSAKKWKDYLNKQYDQNKKGKLPPSTRAQDTAGKSAKAKAKMTVKDFNGDWEAWSKWKDSQLED